MLKTDLLFSKPLMNAAGTLGFSPDPKSPVDLEQFGAFVTNPVSWTPRTPAKGERYIPFPGGFLLHTGYPNPGLKTIIRKHARRWARSPLPVIVHLLAQDAATIRRMVQQLEGLEGVMGIEIGLPPDIAPHQIHEIALASVGELAVILRLPFEDRPNAIPGSPKLDSLSQTGISALSLAPPRGILLGRDGTPVSGRLYGPSVFPLAFSVLTKLVASDLPVIAAGGVYSQKDASALLAAGAMAVQVDSVLWRDGTLT